MANLLEKYNEELRKEEQILKEAVFVESMIPSFVWDFVKKLIKNPIKAGILAFLVWNFLSKLNKKDTKVKIK